MAKNFRRHSNFQLFCNSSNETSSFNVLEILENNYSFVPIIFFHFEPSMIAANLPNFTEFSHGNFT